MTSSSRGIDLVLTFAIAVSTSHGCGRVSLGSAWSADGAAEASVDAAATASIGGTRGSATGGVAGGSHDTGVTAGTSSAGTGGDAGAGGDGTQVPYCGISADVGRVDCGDINRDWVIDTRDALLLAQYVEGMAVTVWLDACDVNCDGQLTIADANMIDSYVVGLISDFPCAPKQR